MPEINIKETRFVPEKPNVIKNEQIEIYIPIGGYHKPGVVSFDSTGFIIDQFGHVKLRRNSVRNISNFEINYETGVLTVYYDDDTVSKVNIPTDTNKLYNRNNLSTTIDIEPGSFVLDVNTGHWFVFISNKTTGFNDDKFIASLEVKGAELENEGYYTVSDTLFKGTDGSLLISVDTEDEKNNFHGRVLLFGGSIFTDSQVISITQDVSKHLFTIHKSDGTREYIQAVTKDFVKDYVNQKTASVYVVKGNIEFSKLPSIEELATGDYLGYVYNVIDDFVADIRFDTASYGKLFLAGTNVVVAQNDDGTYKFDVLGGLTDLSDYISNKGGTIHGGLVFDGVSETIYSSIDANEFKLANANKELSVNLSNITLYDVETSTYTHVDYPTQSGRLMVDTEIDYAVKVGITMNSETLTSDEQLNAQKWLGIDDRFATINAVLEQSGIVARYMPTIEDTYNERITAGGLNVLDGSFAELEKVVGSTVKCNNLIPFPYYAFSKNGTTSFTTNGITYTLQDDGGIYVKGTATTYAYCDLAAHYGQGLDLGDTTISVAETETSKTGGGYCLSKTGSAANKVYFAYDGNNKSVWLRVKTDTTVDGVVYPMANAGETAEPYEKYFAGLKSASFAGIESTGRNLFNAKAIKNTNIKVNSDGSEILMPLDTIGNGATKTDATLSELCPDLRVGDTVYLNYEQSTSSGNGVIYLGTPSEYLWYINTSHTITENDLKSPVNLYGNRFISGYTEQVALLDFRIVRVKDTPFAPYVEPSILNFPKTELGEWDKVEFENQKVVRGTETIVFNGTENWEFLNSYISLRNVPSIANANNGICNLYPYLYQFAGKCIFVAGSYLRLGTALGETFNNDVAKWKAHLAELYASGNPLMIAYKLETPTETPFTAEQSASGNEYKAYSGGTERVLGNDNAEFGAINTLSQNYIIVTGVK